MSILVTPQTRVRSSGKIRPGDPIYVDKEGILQARKSKKRMLVGYAMTPSDENGEFIMGEAYSRMSLEESRRELK